MASLIYRALDAHVVHGLADEPALDDGTTALTYAQLLAEVAAIAGGLFRIGVRRGTPIDVKVRGAWEVVAVLACARLGAVPDAAAQFRIMGDPPVIHADGEEVPWATLLSIGKTDPEAAPEADDPGYAERLMDAYADIFATLTAGGTIS